MTLKTFATKLAAALEALDGYGAGKAADGGVFDGDDTMPVWDVVVNSESDTAERMEYDGSISSNPILPVLKRYNVTFKTELRGGGATKQALGNPGKMDTLFKAASMAALIKLDYDGGTAIPIVGETITGGTSGATATVVAVDGDATSGTMTISTIVGGTTGFVNDEALTGDDGVTPSATVANGTCYVEYRPCTDNQYSAEIRVDEDGVLTTLKGCRGTFKINFEVGAFPIVEWQFWGLFNAQANGTVSDETNADDSTPEEVKNIGLTIDSYDQWVTRNLEVDLGNDVTRRDSINAYSAILGLDGIVGFEVTKHNTVGSFEPERTRPTGDSDSVDIQGKWAAGTQMVLEAALGTATGNTIEFDAPKVQFVSISPTDQDNIRKYSTTLRFAKNAGNDEIVITFK